MFKTAKEAEEGYVTTGKEMLHEIRKFCLKREGKGYSNGELLKDSDKVYLAESLIFSKSPFELMAHYYYRVLPNKQQISNREAQFFINNNNLYPDVPDKHVKFLTDLWTNQTWGFTNVNRNFFWLCMDCMTEAVEQWSLFPEIKSRLEDVHKFYKKNL